jgi:riboflavin kinase, archaea type
MTLYEDLYERRTGVRLFPGSLNVDLGQEWLLPANAMRLEPSEYGGRVGMNIVPCLIEAIPGFILRTDGNNAGNGDHPTSVIEVAAQVHLRSALNLMDGDVVEVIVKS